MNSIHPPVIVWKFLDMAILACLFIVLTTLIYGHMGVEESGLSLTESYVTEYMKKAPHWPWLIVASFSFALVLFLLAFSFLLQGGRSLLVIVACLLLAATSMANFFVAYAPVRRVEQPPPTYEWWTPTWWFTSRTSRIPFEHGMADAYSDVHYRATRLVVVTGVSAIFLLGVAWWGLPGSRGFSRLTVLAAIAMSILFLMGDNWTVRRGLWQRLGFMVMYAWLWLGWFHVRSTRSL